MRARPATGRYLSPHLLDVTERFSVCGVDMTREEFAEEWERLQPYLDHVDAMGMGEVTYFEAVTALAFLWFADTPVGLGAIEVGMGGSWDATNLVAGDVAVITPVGMDHVAELGPTLADIAGEKAGIVKAGKIAVVREQDPDGGARPRPARRRGRRAPPARGRGLGAEETLLAVGGQSIRAADARARPTRTCSCRCSASYAAANAAAGVVAFETLTERGLDEATLRDGSRRRSATPGRLEVVGHEPLVVLDGAHNPDGAAALAGAFARAFRWERLHVVLAVSANKDVAGVVAPIAALADTVHATRNDSVRSADPRGRRRCGAGRPAPSVRGPRRASAKPSTPRARRRAAATRSSSPGSLFTVADAKRALAKV